MRKHTTIDIDVDLVRQAGAALGTSTMTETVHAALSEAVRRRTRRAIADLRPALDLSDLDAMRAHRFAEDRAPYSASDADRATSSGPE